MEIRCYKINNKIIKMQPNFSTRNKSTNHNRFQIVTQKEAPFKIFPQFASKREEYKYQHCHPGDATTLFQATKKSVSIPNSNKMEIKIETNFKKKESAINELLELVTPREMPFKRFDDSADNYVRQNIGHRINLIQTSKQEASYQIRMEEEQRLEKNAIRGEKEDFQIFKIDKNTLKKEQLNSKSYILKIAQLQEKLAQVQQQKTYNDSLLKTAQEELSSLQSQQLKHEQNFKEQVLINLQLEALLATVTIRHKQQLQELHSTLASLKQTIVEQQTNYQKQIEQKSAQFQKAKAIGQQQINQLLRKLYQKNNQINSLQQEQQIQTFNNQPLFSNKFGLSTLPSNHLLDSLTQKLAPPSLETLTHHLNTGELKKQQIYTSQPNGIKTKTKHSTHQADYNIKNVQKTNYSYQRPFCKTDRI